MKLGTFIVHDKNNDIEHLEELILGLKKGVSKEKLYHMMKFNKNPFSETTSIFLHDLNINLFRFDIVYSMSHKVIHNISAIFYNYENNGSDPWHTVTDYDELLLILKHMNIYKVELQKFIDRMYGIYMRTVSNETGIDSEMKLLSREYQSDIIDNLSKSIMPNRYIQTVSNVLKDNNNREYTEYIYSLDKYTDITISDSDDNFDVSFNKVSLRNCPSYFYFELSKSAYVSRLKDHCTLGANTLKSIIINKSDKKEYELLTSELMRKLDQCKVDGFTVDDDGVARVH